MKIESKYNSRCKACGERIYVGETIEWTKKSGAVHVMCPEGEQEENSAFIVIEDYEKEIYGYKD